MRLHLDAFYMYLLATVQLPQFFGMPCMLQFSLHAFHLLETIGLSVSFIQHFDRISLNPDFQIHRVE
jgi:hypothetical protein